MDGIYGKKTASVSFTKMHGTGNDYIYVDTFRNPLRNPAELAVKWSAPHTGIGSDGLVLIGSSEIADFSMRIFNSDGSEAMMCGNASRCIGKYVYEQGLTNKKIITLETESGVKDIRLKVEGDKVVRVSVNMGKPVIGEVMTPLCVGNWELSGTAVSMGNPHLVIFVDDITLIDVSAVGAILEHHPMFPDRTNVEFVQVLETSNLRMRVWERGSGLTLACGTGACASTVASVITNRSGRKSAVYMDGGRLDIEWEGTTDNVWMTGNAVSVFEGIIEI